MWLERGPGRGGEARTTMVWGGALQCVGRSWLYIFDSHISVYRCTYGAGTGCFPGAARLEACFRTAAVGDSLSMRPCMGAIPYPTVLPPRSTIPPLLGLAVSTRERDASPCRRPVSRPSTTQKHGARAGVHGGRGGWWAMPCRQTQPPVPRSRRFWLSSRPNLNKSLGPAYRRGSQ